jgi:hypothetical protein
MRCLWVAGISAVLVAGVSSVAAARPLETGEFTDEFHQVFEDFCDVANLTVQIDTVVEGRFSAKIHGSEPGPEELVYFTEHLEVSRTFTAGDNVVTGEDNVLNHDLTVTDNGDGTLTIIILSTGNATLYGANGKAIGRNPGQVRTELVVDHNGTPGDPRDDEFISETLIKGSTGRSDDFCEVVVPALT